MPKPPQAMLDKLLFNWCYESLCQSFLV
uniref:Uncharacterized protein n=1 Tax=Arundo donax TaxID=35708 RepID=A0A0A8YES5_ARUDO